jgi:hypothetical protein
VPDTTRRPIYVEHKPAEPGAERSSEETPPARATGPAKAAPSPPLAPIPAAAAPRSPLAKFADGSPKNALILATIIGRPLGDG